MVKILFPSSFELKTNQFSGKDFFWFWNSHISGLKKPITLTAMTFFCRHLFLDRKGVTPRNSAPVPPSLATPLWYSTYIRTGGAVFICLAVVQYL